jgi:hypothetical protein
MGFLKRLFSKGEKPQVEPLRGGETHQTDAEQHDTRGRMEAEMDRQREQRTPTPPEKTEDKAESK